MTVNEDTPIGATFTYRPVGSFLPVDREFPWATPNDIAFVLRAFLQRQERAGGPRVEITEAFREARASQLEWYEERLVLSLREGLGWWAHLLPKRLVDRIVEKAMAQHLESTTMWAMELAGLYEQVDDLQRRVGSIGRTRAHQARIRQAESYGPQILCGGGCDLKVPLANPMVVPVGWTVGAGGVPLCPAHSVADVMTSPKVGVS